MNMRLAPQVRPSLNGLALLFLISGFAALIYQIVWERVLFTAFGVNIESVTIIVSVFMFGLGVGSLVGGVLSQRLPRRLPQLVLLCEVAIGLFGVVSLPLMRAVSQVTLHSSLFTMALTAYALLSLPTIFMGATLPILVAQLNRQYQNVGQSVALLYFLNTAGSAMACFLTVGVLFVIGGLQLSVFVACLCNLLVGVLVYVYVTKTARLGIPD
jgi:predicted membrane-bound spermidine synthase